MRGPGLHDVPLPERSDDLLDLIRGRREEVITPQDSVHGLAHKLLGPGRHCHGPGVCAAGDDHWTVGRVDDDGVLRNGIFAQNAELYADIVFSDEDRRGVLLDFFDHHGRLAELVREGDKDGFIQEFTAIGAFFGDFAQQAMEESGYLIHRLADRFAPMGATQGEGSVIGGISTMFER